MAKFNAFKSPALLSSLIENRLEQRAAASSASGSTQPAGPVAIRPLLTLLEHD
jgi:hypothetical protein